MTWEVSNLICPIIVYFQKLPEFNMMRIQAMYGVPLLPSLRNSTIFVSAIFSAEEHDKFTVRYFGNRFGTVRQTLRQNTVVTAGTHARKIAPILMMAFSNSTFRTAFARRIFK